MHLAVKRSINLFIFIKKQLIKAKIIRLRNPEKFYFYAFGL